jgi:acyl transferase domain-containing protein/acyl carrier protein
MAGKSDLNGSEIAIIGMHGRFPGAASIAEFWVNLRDGVESVSPAAEQDGDSANGNSQSIRGAKLVTAEGVLDDVDLFDAAFFGFSPREAELMDPQHRVFLECAWAALENAGYNPETYHGQIGVYAGIAGPTYLFYNISTNPTTQATMDQIWIGNGPDFLSTRVSYKLNLKGPSYVIHSSCSTSLVAIHIACQNILAGECDVALAGGVAINSRQGSGYLYQEGGIGSSDGHCRAFDAKAGGTVGGNGVGIVVLKRLIDALDDGDYIHALIKGSAINNDGAIKMGYTVPSVEGQAKVIVEALSIAGVDPETISYVEAHGTGTPLGDPIEIAALTKAYRMSTQRKNFCAIGTVKTNVGHLDAAAGVTGFIKTVLSLEHKLIPPSLHFEEPNPKIDFENSPFFINTKLSEWIPQGPTRRAGVSSFGIGGTNAHMVLEEAPAPSPPASSRPWQLLMLSARTQAALEQATSNLAQHLRQQTSESLPDICYTYQVGRKVFGQRRYLVCRDSADALAALDARDPQRVFTAQHEATARPVVFMFPGQGSQRVNMAAELYASEHVFHQQVDLCAELLKPHLNLDLRELIFKTQEETKEASGQLDQTRFTQPALFVIEYALAKLLMEWKLLPQAMVGHSIGEYVAACLAGVFSLEDALSLVAARGGMIQALPGGAMLSVPLAEDEARALLAPGLSLAAINGPKLCVISGTSEYVARLEDRLRREKMACRRLHTSHAFHSEMMEPILGPFLQQLNKVKLSPPNIPYLSNVTGTWIKKSEAIDPHYWVRHLREPVRFAASIEELLKEPSRILLEVGPGRTMSMMARQSSPDPLKQAILSTLPDPHRKDSEQAHLLNTLGQLWLAGITVNWNAFYAQEQRRRLPLPTYPFERQSFWIESRKGAEAEDNRSSQRRNEKADIANWFYVPSWRRSVPLALSDMRAEMSTRKTWLVFAGDNGLGQALAKRLEDEGQAVIKVRAGNRFWKDSEQVYTINPHDRHDYDLLLRELSAREVVPSHIAHLWNVNELENVAGERSLSEESVAFERSRYTGFYSLLFLAQLLGELYPAEPIRICVVSNGLHDLMGEESVRAEKGMLLGPCKVIPQEYPNIRCQSVDVRLQEGQRPGLEDELVKRLIAEALSPQAEPVVAYRGNHRWVQTFVPLKLEREEEADDNNNSGLKQGGVYLLTGGLGNIGLIFSKFLARTVSAKLVLTGRSNLPERGEWDQWLKTHEESDETSSKIKALQELEALGAELLIASADVTDESQMRAVVTAALERFGRIDGVIHGAGAVGEKVQRSIQEISPLECEMTFQAKVRGLISLTKALEGCDLDFFILQSSLSTILGGLGFVAYSAANLFMDHFAVEHLDAVPAKRFISVNWDGWKFRETSQADGMLGGMMAMQGITPGEGLEAFQRLLSSDMEGQIVISITDLDARIAQWVKLESLHKPERKNASSAVTLYARPALDSNYVAPVSEIEKQIAEVWQKLLGIEQVGTHDNFFELGGHSLLGVQLMSHLREIFQLEVPLRSLFDAPTISGLALAVETEQIKKQDTTMAQPELVPLDNKTIDQLLAELD